MTETKTEQNATQKVKALSKTQKWIMWIALAAALYTGVGFLAVPPIAKMVLEKKLPEILHRQVTIEKINLNPYSLTASIQGFALQRKDTRGNLISFERVSVDLQSASLFKMALIIKSVDLSRPEINFTRNQDQTFSFADLIPKKTEKKLPSEEIRPFLFSINNITISNGRINVSGVHLR